MNEVYVINQTVKSSNKEGCFQCYSSYCASFEGAQKTALKKISHYVDEWGEAGILAATAAIATMSKYSNHNSYQEGGNSIDIRWELVNE